MKKIIVLSFVALSAMASFASDLPGTVCGFQWYNDIVCVPAAGDFLTCDPYFQHQCISGGNQLCLDYGYYPPQLITVNCRVYPTQLSCELEVNSNGVGTLEINETYCVSEPLE